MIHLDERFVLWVREKCQLFVGQVLRSVQSCFLWVKQRNAFA